MKQFSFRAKALTGLFLAAAVCLALSIAAFTQAVRQTRAAVGEIGSVACTEEVRARIDAASGQYRQLLSGIGATTTFRAAVNRAVGYDSLASAQTEYVRLAIKSAVVADQRRFADGNTEEEIRLLAAAARDSADAYFGEDGYDSVENYAELEALERKYASAEAPSPAGGSTGQSQEEVELC